MNRFIVRTHQYTCNLHWREGVVLSHQGHLARVELFPKRKELRIEVWSGEPYAFLVILKETMDLILSRFEGLRVRQEVSCICHLHTGEVQSCPEVYRYQEDLVKRLNQGIETIQCRESFWSISIRELLYGLHVSTTSQMQKVAATEQQDVLQRLDVLAEQQDILRLGVLAEQQNIIRRLDVLVEQQSRKESINNRQWDAPPYDVPQYKEKSRFKEPSSPPPTLLKKAWNWYRRQQSPKQRKSSKKFNLGCALLIIAPILCVLVSRMLPGNEPSSNASNVTSSSPIATRQTGHTPSVQAPTAAQPHVGGKVSDFLSAYGQPSNSQPRGVYNFFANSDQSIIVSVAVKEQNIVKSISVVGSINSGDQEGFCNKFLPDDKVLQKSDTTGPTTILLYDSASAGPFSLIILKNSACSVDLS